MVSAEDVIELGRWLPYHTGVMDRHTVELIGIAIENVRQKEWNQK
jgi:hypothetical protein